MPQTWVVDAPSRQCLLPAGAVATLLDAAQDDAPAAKMLAFLNSVVAVDHLTLVRYDSGAARSPPRLVEGRARDAAAQAVPAHCFAIYRGGYWRSDQATAIAERLRERRAADGAVTALHFRPADIPLAAWRREIYDEARLVDRFSFLYALSRDDVFAINLYRDSAAGAFRPAEVQSLLGLAPLLRQVHRGAWRTAAARPDPEATAAMLRRRVPALSARELAVCARIACGISADGIAADLGIAPSTVATLRKRAYAKLADAGIAGGRLALARLA